MPGLGGWNHFWGQFWEGGNFEPSYNQPVVVQKIPGFVGDTLSVPRSIPSLIHGRSVVKAWITLKKKESYPDSQALIQKTITASFVSGLGQITDDGSATGTAQLNFSFTSVDTAFIGSKVVLFYEIQLRLDNGEIITYEKGRFSLSNHQNPLYHFLEPHIIQGFTSGERLDIIRNIPVPTGKTIKLARIFIKVDKGDSDNELLIQKLITSSSSPDVGVILDTSDAFFQLVESDTTALGTHRVLYYKILVEFNDGTITNPFEEGLLVLVPRVTNTNS